MVGTKEKDTEHEKWLGEGELEDMEESTKNRKRGEIHGQPKAKRRRRWRREEKEKREPREAKEHPEATRRYAKRIRLQSTASKNRSEIHLLRNWLTREKDTGAEHPKEKNDAPNQRDAA